MGDEVLGINFSNYGRDDLVSTYEFEHFNVRIPQLTI